MGVLIWVEITEINITSCPVTIYCFSHSSQRKLRKVLGIELAPLNIPLHRRLETLAIAHFASCFLLLGPFCFLLTVILLFTRLYWITLMSYAWLIYDRDTSSTGGRRINWVRRWGMWRHMANFFPGTVHIIVLIWPENEILHKAAVNKIKYLGKRYDGCLAICSGFWAHIRMWESLKFSWKNQSIKMKA